MRVLVYPEKTYEEFGAERWEIDWQEVKPSALERIRKDPTDEVDIDSDLVTYRWHCTTEQQARNRAKNILKIKAEFLAFGSVRLTRQIVDWFVEEDRVAEWTDVGEPVYVEAL